MNGQLVHVNGFDISYIEEGKGHLETLVFAHGLGGNIDQWVHQIEFFKDRYHVIAFSLQGHGSSSKTGKAEDYQMKSYGRTAVALLETLNIGSCTWIGNSMGGLVGYEVIQQKPELVNQLVTNGTTPELKYGKAALKMIEIADKAMIRFLGFEKYSEIAAKATLKDEKKRQEIKAMFIQTEPFAIIQSHQVLGDYSNVDSLKTMALPVSIILTPGDKDINKSIKRVRRQLLGLKNVSFETMKCGGHVVNMELPEAYNRMLEKILRKVDRYAG